MSDTISSGGFSRANEYCRSCLNAASRFACFPLYSQAKWWRFQTSAQPAPPVSFCNPRSKQYVSPDGSASVGVGSPTRRHKSMKCACDPARSVSADARHLLMNSYGVMGAFRLAHDVTRAPSRSRAAATFGESASLPGWSRSFSPPLPEGKAVAERFAVDDHTVASFTCTVQLARAQWGIRPTKLPDVCRRLRIPLRHHAAESDAVACARIVLAVEATGWRALGHQRPSRAELGRLRRASRAMIYIGPISNRKRPDRSLWSAVISALRTWWRGHHRPS